MPPERSETGTSKPGQRVGDAQRADCAETLAEAFARGELSRPELDARTELCFAAVTVTASDLSPLTSDLPARTTTSAEAVVIRRGATPRPMSLVKVLAFEVVLALVAHALGVDLESGLRSRSLIALEIWVVGNVAGIAGAFFRRSFDGVVQHGVEGAKQG